MVGSKYPVRFLPVFFRVSTTTTLLIVISVLAMAARDILSRSRLDNDSLAKIW